MASTAATSSVLFVHTAASTRVVVPMARFTAFRASLSLVFFAFIADHPGATETVELSPAMFLSSKTPYYPQQHYSTYEAVPQHCKLVHINHLGRHGSRHSTKLKAPLHLYDTLADALRLGKLKPRGVMLLQWIARFSEAEGDKLGERSGRDGQGCMIITCCIRASCISPPPNS